MGFFDKIKNSLGVGAKPAAENVKGPTTVLREAGIDPSCVDCKIHSDGSLTVSGTVASGEERDRIVGLLGDIPQVSRVINEINVAPPEAPSAPDPVTEVEVPAGPGPTAGVDIETGGAVTGEAESTARSYTVKSGDTLWKIAQEMYGDGSKYTKIFEANRALLDDPDRIFPGQELSIPNLED